MLLFSPSEDLSWMQPLSSVISWLSRKLWAWLWRWYLARWVIATHFAFWWVQV